MEELRCPFCEEERTFKTFYGLQKHIRAVHANGNYCPVCKEEFKNLLHHLSMNREKDDLHLILYAALARSRTANKEILHKCKDKAIKILTVKK